MTGTVVVRRVIATPGRPAATTWGIIADLIAPEGSPARTEIDAIAGVAISLIAAEAMRDSPLVVYGAGPRLRIYCLYDDDAMLAEGASEEALAWRPTDGDWAMSVPCPPDDLSWVQQALARSSDRITARDWDEYRPPERDTSELDSHTVDSGTVNVEAFLRP